MPDVKPDSAETKALLERARAGDNRALDRLFARHRRDLLSFVELRLDRKLRTRVDPSDVIQEPHLEAVRIQHVVHSSSHDAVPLDSEGLLVRLVDELETLAPGQRADPQVDFAELPCAACLFLVTMVALRLAANRLAVSDLRGGTFTITNGGIFGSMLSTPILNPPQSAILGMHNIQQRPMVIDGEIKVRPMMYLAVTYDHRIIDGREAVQFLVTIKQQLEDPGRLLLNI